ncbi:MAG: alpha-galactosidase [Christensenellales bacterium]|jgi:alpha-galactosidase
MIRFWEKEQILQLDTLHTSYAMQITQSGRLVHLYWAESVRCVQDFPTIRELTDKNTMHNCSEIWHMEYPGWGEGQFNMHGVKATYADGTRNVFLRYAGHHVDDEKLVVTLRDALGLQVELIYQAYPEWDIIDRSVRFTNGASQKIVLENAFSALWRFQETGEYRLTHLAGDWGKEYQIQRQQVQRGTILLETKNNLSGPANVPMFMMDDGAATELRGMVYFGTLQWSGNFRIYVEKAQNEEISVVGGISDFDFEYPLAPGESFETPVFTGGIAQEGFSGASRLLHRYQRRVLIRKRDADSVMPVIINTYGTFMGNVNEEKVMAIIDKAERVGAEALIIDAGWSGVGDFYQLGMGDWNINKERFPGQLLNISKRLHEKGMLFGLWLEPEIAHVDSQLIKEHPDWVLRYAGRPVEINSKGRVFLNFALDEVWRDILQKVICLIETCEIDYYKMDLNRMVVELGSTCMPPELQKSITTKYVQNLYRFYEGLVNRFPDMLIENCAGGGQRVDLAMTRFSGRINRSDNQDPLDILKIHEGFTYFMLSKFAGGGCHIAKYFPALMNHRHAPVRFQAHVAMMGSLAIGENLATCTDEELEEIAQLVARHKELRHITHLGEIYRLASAWEEPYAVFEYVLPDRSEAAVFAYGQSMQFCRKTTRRIRLAGLEADALYDVEGYGVRSGAGLMHAGLQIQLTGDMDSAVIKLTKV